MRCRFVLRFLVTGVSSVTFGSGCFSQPSPDVTPNLSSGTTDAAASASAGPRGCAVDGGAPAIAPGGYYVNGAQVCTADGQPHLFHGVDRPSLEWSPVGESISAADFQQMASWHANTVRIATNQDFWLSGAALYDPDYRSTIQNAVTWAEQAGLDVILDLHWSDRGNLNITMAGGNLPSGAQANDTVGYDNQQPMADVNSLEYWKEVAATFQNDGHVLFELYNEPNDVSWGIWLNGGKYQEYQVVGMQQLYDAVRATGANNLVVVGGLNWAFDLSGVAQYPVIGYNVLYATHPYKGKSNWSTAFEYLSTGNIAPVIATEFGDSTQNCTGAWDQSLIAAAAEPTLQISWTAWAWYDGDPCSFPSLISDFSSYTPTVQGQVVYDALTSDPAPQSWIDSGVTGGSLDSSVGDEGSDSATTETDAGTTGTDAGGAEADSGDAATPVDGLAPDQASTLQADAGPDAPADAATTD